ncbi:hypothetical protein HY991_03715 [Candidatus Micrarchaeota archaeon]|nr:hypothetical protein [Candidatus Micrarchaeota archaeon]
MDFTFLLLVILMLLALQAGQQLIAAGLFIILIFSAKSKLLLIFGIIGLAIATVFFLGWEGMSSAFIIVGLFLILVVIIKVSPPEPGPEAYYPGGYA